MSVTKETSKTTASKTVDKTKKKAGSEVGSSEKQAVSKLAVKKETFKIKVPKENYYGTGKRKTSIAKVWLFPGTGQMEVNGMTPLAFFGTELLATMMAAPLKHMGLLGKYDCKISTLGGGIVGQVGACRLGIARALLVMNETFRKSLRDGDFLTRDPRVKEGKKYGRKRARKGFQYRKR
jgi:small subunit ribosomal protein S9